MIKFDFFLRHIQSRENEVKEVAFDKRTVTVGVILSPTWLAAPAFDPTSSPGPFAGTYLVAIH
jgi:hypothetical protein